MGKILYREIRRSHLLALLIDKKFKPIHDRITNPPWPPSSAGIDEPTERKHAAQVFLELFRLLHYLEYADPAHADEDDLKNTILDLRPHHLRDAPAPRLPRAARAARRSSPTRRLYELYDSFVYCLPFELKKVINTELLDISVARQPDIVRARVENSHGILKDCFQQSVVQLAQVFDAEGRGQRHLPDFTAKLEQSVRLRDGLACLDPGRAASSRRRKDGHLAVRHEGRAISRLLRHTT